jgi:hypothetical protein
MALRFSQAVCKAFPSRLASVFQGSRELSQQSTDINAVEILVQSKGKAMSISAPQRVLPPLLHNSY